MVKGRLCKTGCRWRRRNIPKILALRITLFNDEWDEYWRIQQAAWNSCKPAGSNHDR
jgi:hypothetical protein